MGSEDSLILQRLLEGQERITNELRGSIDKQQSLERNAEAAKTNLFALTCKVSEVFSTQVEVIDAVDFNSEDILDLREGVRDNQQAITNNSKQNREIMKMLHKVNERLDMIERRQLELGIEVKAKSVVINGLEETQDEIPIQKAYDFLKCIDTSLKLEDIDIAYRIGLPNTRNIDNVPRSLIVVFYGLSKKRGIMSAKNSLRNDQKLQKVFVNDDLPVEARQNREKLREISTYAKEHGYESKVSGDKLTVNGKIYKPHELDLLPREISLEKIRTRKRGDGIAFQGETSCLSNFYPCDLNMWNLTFNCSEQAFQYLKCITCKKEDTAHQIMLLSQPREIKAKGDKSETTPAWESMKLKKMEEIVTQKFLQNPTLKRKLCDTGNYPLYEATSNQYWGCGLRLNSRHWASGITLGQNHMGQILMRVRDKMRDSDASLHRHPSAAAGKPHGLNTDAQKDLSPPTGSQVAAGDSESTHEEMDTVTNLTSCSTSTETARPEEPPLHTSHHPANEDHDLMNSSGSSSATKSGNNSFRDFSTNHEFDICKVNSWKLPKVKRNTREWREKVQSRGLLKRRRSDRVDNPDPKVYHSTPRSHSPPQRKRISRSFVNSNYQNQLMAEHGYDLESTYKRAMSSYNKENITDRKSIKK